MNARTLRGGFDGSGGGEESRLAAALFWSAVIHMLFLASLASGKIGLGLARESDSPAMPRLEVRFLAAKSERMMPTAETRFIPCADCTETTLQPAAEENWPAGPAGKPRGDTEQAGYWPVALLDTPPRPLQEIDLNTPELDATAVNGVVELNAWISARGRVEDVHVLRVDAASDSPLLRRLLAERFLGASFSPGLLNGRPVASSVPITVVIEPQ